MPFFSRAQNFGLVIMAFQVLQHRANALLARQNTAFDHFGAEHASKTPPTADPTIEI